MLSLVLTRHSVRTEALFGNSLEGFQRAKGNAAASRVCSSPEAAADIPAHQSSFGAAYLEMTLFSFSPMFPQGGL